MSPETATAVLGAISDLFTGGLITLGLAVVLYALWVIFQD